VGRRVAWYAAVLGALVVASLLAAATALHQAQDRSSDAAADRAARGAVALERVFAGTVASLDGVRALFTARPATTGAEFRAYSAHLLAEHGLTGVMFAASVPRAQRAAYERRTGRPLMEPGLLGLRPAGRRDRYYPVTYAVSSVTDASRALGVDIGTDPLRLEALESARDSGSARATPPLGLLASRQLGVQVFEPIYAPGLPHRTAAERRAALVGFAGGGFQTDAVGARLLAQMPAGTRLQIFDGPTQVFGPSGTLDAAAARSVLVAGRHWRVVAAAPGVALALPLSLLVAGLLASALVALLCLQSLRRERYALALVDERLREQRAVEAALREREGELRRERDYAGALVAAMHDGLFVLSPSGGVVEASPSLCELTGFSSGELIGARLPYPFWPEGSHERLARAFTRLDAEGAAEWDLEFRHRDGRAIPVILSAFVLRGPEGGVTGYAATVKDVTERRAVQQLKDEFIALASHELRTPLSSVLGYLEIVLEEGAHVGPLTDQQRRFLGVAERNAQKLVRLVGDLLVVGRADSGRLVLERSEVDLAAMVRECGESARPGADERDILLRVSAEHPVRCAVDRARIAQVIDNLVSNALKFTPPGGRVELSVAAAADGALIEVVDTGIGIAPAEQARLFERFYRTSAATREAIPGTGLGLAISRMIVAAHGGRIWFESEEGRGSTFRVALPLAGAVAASGPPPAEATRA